VPRAGSGTFRRAEVTARTPGNRGRLIRYDVAVERELRLDADAQARAIHGVLADERSWRRTGRWRFALVASGRRADLHIYLATPDSTDRLCAPLRTLGKVSCQIEDRVVLNARRWVFGADAYGKDVVRYRQYLVNHEVGHFLGFGHEPCPGSGRRAPIMQQQTKGLDGCRANPWPPRRSNR